MTNVEMKLGKKTDRLGLGEEGLQGVYDCDIYRNGEARRKDRLGLWEEGKQEMRSV